jgi:hypothetical protein
MTSTRLVHGVGVRAIEWLHAHRDGFCLEPDVTFGTGFLERFKPIGELAMICAVLFREGVAGSRQAGLAREPVDHAWRHTLDGGRVLVEGRRVEPLSPIPFEVYLPFRELGYDHPGIEEAARPDRGLLSTEAFATTSTRRLGLSAFQRRFGPQPRPPESEAADGTWLGRTPAPWTVEGHLAYDITQTPSHRPIRSPAPRDCPRRPTTSTSGHCPPGAPTVPPDRAGASPLGRTPRTVLRAEERRVRGPAPAYADLPYGPAVQTRCHSAGAAAGRHASCAWCGWRHW